MEAAVASVFPAVYLGGGILHSMGHQRTLEAHWDAGGIMTKTLVYSEPQ